jgi:hypothetical protein
MIINDLDVVHRQHRPGTNCGGSFVHDALLITDTRYNAVFLGVLG